APKRPNVVLIFADDLGFGDPSFAGHPTNLSPNLDQLRARGKRVTAWYSGCPVCTGSRASLMTGRVYARVGVPGVFGAASQTGLPLREKTIADQLRSVGYATAMLGKWHLGQREVYLPARRGFDSYLGVPFSDDMGQARMTARTGTTTSPRADADADRGGNFLPLVSQTRLANGTVQTVIVEQPLDLTHLGEKYATFASETIRALAAGTRPWFLYAALSHVHTTADNIPEKQFSGCAFRGKSPRGAFGDALAEADSVVGAIVSAVDGAGAARETLYIFSSDNGPWMVQGTSAGSVGHLYAAAAGYWNVGKGSTWEGGIREPALIVWEGVVEAGSSTNAAVSSTDVFVTLSKLVGAKIPDFLEYNGNRTPAIYDGVDQSESLFGSAQQSKRDGAGECLFFFGGPKTNLTPSAARCGPYKLHYATGPGLGGCAGCEVKHFDPPLVFHVEADPSEQFAVSADLQVVEAVLKIAAASLAAYMAHFEPGVLDASNGGLAPDAPYEVVDGTALYGVCCNRHQANTCQCSGAPYPP
ncbi:alkaline-phosphatase-like protein, partial [Pelagophyceae sp. CCMP2097]